MAGDVQGLEQQGLNQRSWGQTYRRDTWWVVPLIVFVVLSAFVVYANWAAFQNAHYTHKNYLSPFYAPVLWGDTHHSWFGPKPTWWPSFIPFSPALLILPFPAGFRMTCYYYRGAYYKAFWSDPPACAVGEPRKSYWGERFFPLILQNIHRYFLYFALLFLCILAYDAYLAFWFDDDGNGTFTDFGVGVGTLVLCLNVMFLTGYTTGCHSLRHLIGGYRDKFSGKPVQTKCYDCVSCLNQWHMHWAWVSLIWVAFSDVYVRLCSMGIWYDFRIF
ncbi:MAG: succinate dehydrogenase [Pirellulaceae bacterium]|nr:succinate dehydrogenase [Pirellulaceae bacterium]